jgi:hypothetical protein
MFGGGESFFEGGGITEKAHHVMLCLVFPNLEIHVPNDTSTISCKMPRFCEMDFIAQVLSAVFYAGGPILLKHSFMQIRLVAP